MAENENGGKGIAPENQSHKYIIRVLLILMGVQWIILLLEQRLLALVLVSLIILTLLLPIFFRKNMNLEIPADFHLMAVFFTFASLYLGEVQSFYHKLWWWDIVLHTSAGLLMGILGFLLVYLLNESQRIDVHMTSGFIAFFAFTFAVCIGTGWEIFEFTMDQIFGLNMQKSMFNDPSGLTDTMWDMIVNATGASIISLLGWRYLKLRENFFVKRWIRNFINKNPRLFKN